MATYGFIDSASIHSALAALSLGKKGQPGTWEQQCLVDSTYLLLFKDIGMVPGPGQYRGASGLFQHVITGLPTLEMLRFKREQAIRSTKRWLTRSPDDLRRAWSGLKSSEHFEAWAAVNRELFWLHHVRMHSSLFDREFVPQIARLLGQPERDILIVHNQSQSEKVVTDWVRSDLNAEDAKLADDAYIAAALIRGRFHEYLASASDLHLAAHPFRKTIRRRLRKGQGEAVLNSEEYFVKAIIGSALMETSEVRRVKTWVENISMARRAVLNRVIALPNAATDSDAVRIGAEAARKAGLSASYARIHRELDLAVALGLSGLICLVLSPWAAPAAPMIVQGYRQKRGVSIGDDIARFTINTTGRFLRLARRVPGRIERE